MELPNGMAAGIAILGVVSAISVSIALLIATLSGDVERIGEIGASMIENAAYMAVAAALGLSCLGAFGAMIIKAFSQG